MGDDSTRDLEARVLALGLDPSEMDEAEARALVGGLHTSAPPPEGILGSGRGVTQVFDGRAAGNRGVVTATGVLGVPGIPVPLAAVGGEGVVRPWNVWASPVIVPRTGQLPPLFQVPAGAGGSTIPGSIMTALVGILEWTIDGARFNAEFDITMGARLSILADRLELRAANESEINDDTLAASNIQVVGGISPGSAASPSPVLRTRYFGDSVSAEPLPGFLPVIVAIPPFARTVVPLVTPIGALGGYTLNFLNSIGAVIGTREYPSRAYGVGPGSQIEGEAAPLILPNDCRGISLVTGAAQARTAHRFIFGLYL